MPVEIIAEAAQGYEGNPTLAQLLARAAVRAGADAVKFQLVYADEVATPDYTYYKLIRDLEMPQEAWETVAQEAKSGGLRLYLDVFGEESLRTALAVGTDGVKIHSTDFFNAHLIRAALRNAPCIFISLGGISPNELQEFLASYKIFPSSQFCLLYGFQAEPTPLESNNLRRISGLKRRFPGFRIGFMDHSHGDSSEAMNLSILALGFEIACIEKHISLDRILELEDYVSALPPCQFKLFVETIRRLETALGREALELTPAELEYRAKVLKVVVADRPLKPGDSITPDALALKRTGLGVPTRSLHRFEQVVRRKARVEIRPGQPITEDLLF